MPHDEAPPEADVNAINSDLKKGLRSCHAIVADYRAMLHAETNDNGVEPSAANDDQSGSGPDNSEERG